jgi:hypothetical protein
MRAFLVRFHALKQGDFSDKDWGAPADTTQNQMVNAPTGVASPADLHAAKNREVDFLGLEPIDLDQCNLSGQRASGAHLCWRASGALVVVARRSDGWSGDNQRGG